MILSHDAVGSGPAVVLLHSSVCDRRMWDAQWQHLVDAGYRVVRCDFRGFGDSPLAYDVPDFREIAAGLPARLPDARHVELPWAGHLPNLERPEEVTELLLGFLSAN